jgi:hypothetical protein
MKPDFSFEQTDHGLPISADYAKRYAPLSSHED